MAQPFPLRIQDVGLWTKPVRTRLPFRFGSSILTECAHLYVVVVAEDGQGQVLRGVAADHVVPKWFDKSPGKTYGQELEEHARMLAYAVEVAKGHGPAPVFQLWLSVFEEVHRRARAEGIAPLVATFAASLIERAAIDAVGRHLELNFTGMVRQNVLGVDLAALDPAVGDVPLADLVANPLPRLHIRHTVGLADALAEAEVPSGSRLHDGLPQSVEGAMEAWGVQHFKVKVSNQFEADLDRLTRLARLLDGRAGGRYLVTLDGNEQYPSPEALLPLLEELDRHPDLRGFARSIAWIEQPFPRQVALDPGLAEGIRVIADRYPLIIDESDATVDSFTRALELGYRGTSHKNCKGVFRSLLNAARCRAYGARGGSQPFLTAEDLTTIGPVSLEADLEVVAALGIPHVERNGHFYFYGLSHLGAGEQAEVAARHAGLYAPVHGVQCLHIEGGAVDVAGLQGPGLGGGHWPRTEDGWFHGIDQLRRWQDLRAG